MTIARAFLALAFSVAPLAACHDDGAPVPAPCETDAECGADGQCLHLHDESGAEIGGYCDAQEMSTSRGTPAPCATNADCGGTIACLHFHDDATGAELGGFCDVDERIACPAAACGGGH